MKKYTLESLKSQFPLMDFRWIKDIEVVLKHIPGPWRFVGGAVRDSLLGKTTYDIDIATTALPEEIESQLKDFTISVVGKKFGTIGVFYKKWSVEITTTRADICTYGRKADVAFVTSFEEDSNRRDFTINALTLSGDTLYDYHNGIKDLKEGNVIFIGNPNQRIQEDYLRILRYIRFLSRFSNKGPEMYMEIITKNLESMKQLSIERVINEIYAMGKYPNTLKGIKIINQLKISNLFFGIPLEERYISDSQSQQEKTAFAFINFPKKTIGKLPLTHDVKYLLNSYEIKYSNLWLNFAFIWNRFHCFERALMFLKIYNLINKTNIQIQKKDTFSYDQSLLNFFENKEKTLVLITMRYFFLKNISYDKSMILDFIQNNMK